MFKLNQEPFGTNKILRNNLKEKSNFGELKVKQTKYQNVRMVMIIGMQVYCGRILLEEWKIMTLALQPHSM